MKKSDIKVGVTYYSRRNRTKRTVLAIGDRYRPKLWHTDKKRPNEPGVLYEQEYGDGTSVQNHLYLSAFAGWAGGVDEESDEERTTEYVTIIPRKLDCYDEYEELAAKGEGKIHTNMFEFDKEYLGRPVGFGYEVVLGGGWYRFIGRDLTGDAHLFYYRDLGNDRQAVRKTIGYFEMIPKP